MVNTTQQIGGSMGTALLNTIAVSGDARTGPASQPPGPARSGRHRRGARRAARLRVAFWWAAVFFGAGAILSFVLLESGVPEVDGDLVARLP
jgi:hypothetical protein